MAVDKLATEWMTGACSPAEARDFVLDNTFRMSQLTTTLIFR
jgi:hypothetical protein